MDVKMPIPQRPPGKFWVQFNSGPSDFKTNAPYLRKAVDYIHTKKTIPDSNIREPSLDKLDCTRDVAGSFYAPGDWKVKYYELKQHLEEIFKLHFRDNGNSMDTCFQFVS